MATHLIAEDIHDRQSSVGVGQEQPRQSRIDINVSNDIQRLVFLTITLPGHAESSALTNPRLSMCCWPIERFRLTNGG